MSKILGTLCISTCLLGLAAHAEAATVWNFATGVDYSAGKYGATSDTTVFSLPFAARAQTGTVNYAVHASQALRGKLLKGRVSNAIDCASPSTRLRLEDRAGRASDKPDRKTALLLSGRRAV